MTIKAVTNVPPQITRSVALRGNFARRNLSTVGLDETEFRNVARRVSIVGGINENSTDLDRSRGRRLRVDGHDHFATAERAARR
jgi:endonuclease V-like protein UPF0215 family